MPSNIMEDDQRVEGLDRSSIYPCDDQETEELQEGAMDEEPEELVSF
jgi:hypothetical protein